MEILRSKLQKALRKHDEAKVRKSRARKRAIEADGLLDEAQEAADIIRTTAKAVQQLVHGKIAGVVTRCLAAVYEDPYEFRIEFVEKRGRTEAQAQFFRDGQVIDPLEESGGGPVDVAALALRLACLNARRPMIRKVLILDEPFRFIGKNHRPAVRALLEALCEDLGVQIIMVTHSDELRAGKVVEL